METTSNIPKKKGRRKNDPYTIHTNSHDANRLFHYCPPYDTRIKCRLCRMNPRPLHRFSIGFKAINFFHSRLYFGRQWKTRHNLISALTTICLRFTLTQNKSVWRNTENKKKKTKNENKKNLERIGRWRRRSRREHSLLSGDESVTHSNQSSHIYLRIYSWYIQVNGTMKANARRWYGTGILRHHHNKREITNPISAVSLFVRQ